MSLFPTCSGTLSSSLLPLRLSRELVQEHAAKVGGVAPPSANVRVRQVFQQHHAAEPEPRGTRPGG